MEKLRSEYAFVLQALLMAGVVLMLFDSVFDRLSVLLGRKAQTKLDTEVRRKTIEIEGIPDHVYEVIESKYLLVRFGNNEFLEQDPSPSDKRKMKVRNTEFSVETEYRELDRTIEATVPFRLHRKLPTEFKLFVEVEDPAELETVKTAFESSPSCASASISGSIDDRVYVVLERFETTTTPEGFRNNVVYPR